MTVSVAVLHPAFGDNARWISDFIEGPAAYRFELYSAKRRGESWHKRGPRTPLSEWRSHFEVALRAVRGGREVIVANFPQLTFAARLLKLLLLRRVKVIGWSFNFGSASKSRVAPLVGQVFRSASLLITHSRAEIAGCAKAFGLPEGKLRFVPVAERDNAAGQVTVVAAMRFGTPIIATRCAGTVGYLVDGVDALLVEPNEPSQIAAALDRMTSEPDLADRLGSAARDRWKNEMSDEASARNLVSILDEVMGRPGRHINEGVDGPTLRKMENQ